MNTTYKAHISQVCCGLHCGLGDQILTKNTPGFLVCQAFLLGDDTGRVPVASCSGKNSLSGQMASCFSAPKCSAISMLEKKSPIFNIHHFISLPKSSCVCYTHASPKKIWLLILLKPFSHPSSSSKPAASQLPFLLMPSFRIQIGQKGPERFFLEFFTIQKRCRFCFKKKLITYKTNPQKSVWGEGKLSYWEKKGSNRL